MSDVINRRVSVSLENLRTDMTENIDVYDKQYRTQDWSLCDAVSDTQSDFLPTWNL